MIAIVVAMDRNRVIGARGRLPWRLSVDLKRFKALTLGHAVIMGRKTFESIGKPLAGRKNIVVSRRKDFAAEGCDVARSLDEALQAAGGGDVYVIGGGEIYAQALPRADRLYVTEIDTEVAGGDAFFPAIDPAAWKLVEDVPAESDGLRCRFKLFIR
jgi:dihydrofolate reductase